MKSLYGRHKETLQRMEQKMKKMRYRMDKALEEKEAVRRHFYWFCWSLWPQDFLLNFASYPVHLFLRAGLQCNATVEGLSCCSGGRTRAHCWVSTGTDVSPRIGLPITGLLILLASLPQFIWKYNFPTSLMVITDTLKVKACLTVCVKSLYSEWVVWPLQGWTEQVIHGIHLCSEWPFEKEAQRSHELVSGGKTSHLKPSVCSVFRCQNENSMLNFANSVFMEQNNSLPPFLNGKLREAQELIQRINPVLHQLHQRTSTAVESSKQHLEMRDRAVEERDLVRHLPLKLNSLIIY